MASKPKIIRNMSTKESRDWWENCKRIAAKAKNWPASRRAGINVSDRRIRGADGK